MPGTSLNDPQPKTDAPSRRTWETWQRAVQQGRMWRFRFTRQRLMDFLKTLVWVVPLTIMIWIYAEREQINSNYPIRDIALHISSSDKSKFVEPVGGIQPKVNLTLSGPLNGLDRVQQQLTLNPQRELLIDLPGGITRGSHAIDVKTYLRDEPLFKINGVSISESQPAEITVNVDDLSEADVKVQLPSDITNVNKATFDPPIVHVRGPRTLMQNLQIEGRLVVYADIRGSDALRRPGAQQVVPDVPVKPAEARLTATPDHVKATLDVRSADVQLPIESMPIWIDCPPSVLENYRVIFPNNDATIANVTVSGPQRAIDALATSIPHADLEVKEGDAVLGEVTKPLHFNHLPDGVRVESVDSKDQTRVIRLEKRGASG